MPPPHQSKPNAPTHMYYEIQSKNLPRKQNIGVCDRNRDVCDSRFISIFSPFTFWSSLLHLHICFVLFLKKGKSTQAGRQIHHHHPGSLLITLYTPWAQMPPVKMQENAKGLITQTQRTDIMFHSGASSSVSKASHMGKGGGVCLHIRMVRGPLVPTSASCSVLMSEPEPVVKIQNIKNMTCLDAHKHPAVLPNNNQCPSHVVTFFRSEKYQSSEQENQLSTSDDDSPLLLLERFVFGT